MKKVIFSQRVEVIENYEERRECIDQNVVKFIYTCGYIPIPVNNIPGKVEEFIHEIKPDGIILTGGNNLVKYGGDAPERDETERKLITEGIRMHIPIYGFCRGMQMIEDYFGCELEKVEGHVRKRHVLSDETEKADSISTKYGFSYQHENVNSYHNFAAGTANLPLVILARSEDGIIEAVCHKKENIYANMWHPERENPFRTEDIERFKKIFG